MHALQHEVDEAAVAGIVAFFAAIWTVRGRAAGGATYDGIDEMATLVRKNVN